MKCYVMFLVSDFFFFCFVLVAIERCKQQLSSGATTTTEYLHGHQSECTSEHVTSSAEEHVFEEFIPLKRATCSAGSDDAHNHHHDDDEEQESPADKSTQNDNDNNNAVIDNKKKSEWLRSVQLWNDPTPDPPQQQVKKIKNKKLFFF